MVPLCAELYYCGVCEGQRKNVREFGERSKDLRSSWEIAIYLTEQSTNSPNNMSS
jgi:hypothetical protein